MYKYGRQICKFRIIRGRYKKELGGIAQGEIIIFAIGLRRFLNTNENNLYVCDWLAYKLCIKTIFLFKNTSLYIRALEYIFIPHSNYILHILLKWVVEHHAFINTEVIWCIFFFFYLVCLRIVAVESSRNHSSL